MKRTKTPSRIAISKICEKFKIPADRFQPLSIIMGSFIQDTIVETFCGPTSEGLLWERIESLSHKIVFLDGVPFNLFLEFVDPEEKIWLIIEEKGKDQPKYWHYDGHTKEIVRIIKKLWRPGEIYLVSKQCNWLLCVTNGDGLYGAGSPMHENVAAIGPPGSLFISPIRKRLKGGK